MIDSYMFNLLLDHSGDWGCFFYRLMCIISDNNLFLRIGSSFTISILFQSNLWLSNLCSVTECYIVFLLIRLLYFEILVFKVSLHKFGLHKKYRNFYKKIFLHHIFVNCVGKIFMHINEREQFFLMSVYMILFFLCYGLYIHV